MACIIFLVILSLFWNSILQFWSVFLECVLLLTCFFVCRDVILLFNFFFLIVILYGVSHHYTSFLGVFNFPEVLEGSLIQIAFLSFQSSLFCCVQALLKRKIVTFWDFSFVSLAHFYLDPLFFFIFIVCFLPCFYSIASSFFSVWGPSWTEALGGPILRSHRC